TAELPTASAVAVDPVSSAVDAPALAWPAYGSGAAGSPNRSRASSDRVGEVTPSSYGRASHPSRTPPRRRTRRVTRGTDPDPASRAPAAGHRGAAERRSLAVSARGSAPTVRRRSPRPR
ncbi:hypothetical protein C5D25_14475, partial [Rathayibacter sp. AY1D7]